MGDPNSSWKAISAAEMRALIEKQLAECTAEDRTLFETIRIIPRKLVFDRGNFREDVFIVAESEGKLIYYDDIEEGFEVGAPDSDGVLRHVGTGQFELCHALAHLRHGWR
jgi:hypothetical protein